MSRSCYGEFLSLFRECGSERAVYFPSVAVREYLEVYSPAVRWIIKAQTLQLDKGQAGERDRSGKKSCFVM